ncbi:sulfate adenylyltransferase subunit CysN [Candidatus Sulfidibacterium hydrothermale]|uniref:sulfate adenylyltransferase subunit CysN n=1 Tax=Candidatus Sulfidibacterium hydrothermale TaxID=2875962 RepID=UPI001F0A1504|nr:sulfate adenylyltransferase subunit CysN [Candidatus Sulfidibacterium hydrothermale]UBM62426.1 sulfate adenylyltransferase subunit CysN [Candidatus Sulfidibacterium hydrothermale]
MDIREFLDQDQKKDLLRLLTAGSVDDGKSTLIGRLLFDSKKLYEDQLSALKRDSKRVGHAGEEIDYALLLDGLKAEREQGITIDVAYRYFSTAKRKFIIADTPGHEQYTRNMITGGSTANLAILLADARKGVITQTKRHTFLVSLLGIKHVVLAVNKMDLVDYKQEVFDRIVEDYKRFITQLDVPDVTFIPLSALKGDNVVEVSDKMPWYHGQSMLEFLETVHVSSDRNFEDFRYPVQYVIRPDLKYRGFAGKMASGVVRKGDEVMVLPSGKKSKVKTITTYDGDLDYAFPPQSISLTLEDEIDISRGNMLVHPDNLPQVSRHFEAMLVWMDEKPMNPFTQFYIKHNTHSTKAKIDQIRYRVDVNTLEHQTIDHFELNEIGRVVITTVEPLYFDAYKKNRQTGAFILIDPITHNTVAVGMMLDKLSSDALPTRITDDEKSMIAAGRSLVSREEREKHYNQKGATLWITGLYGSGKNELAFVLEKELIGSGATVVVLDGKSLRSGLSRELDFDPADRAEHLRRVAHIARILNDQGILTICSFTSPDENVRRQVAEIIGPDRFHLIYMDADVEYCKKHADGDLYERYEKGEVRHLPGVDMPYEIPEKPQLVFRPEEQETNTEKVLEYLKENKIFPLE